MCCISWCIKQSIQSKVMHAHSRVPDNVNRTFSWVKHYWRIKTPVFHQWFVSHDDLMHELMQCASWILTSGIGHQLFLCNKLCLISEEAQIIFYLYNLLMRFAIIYILLWFLEPVLCMCVIKVSINKSNASCWLKTCTKRAPLPHLNQSDCVCPRITILRDLCCRGCCYIWLLALSTGIF